MVDLNITIEQLPIYPGALVFDGVDDYGVCDNFPILTKEKGYTVVALRQYLVEKSTAYLTANTVTVYQILLLYLKVIITRILGILVRQLEYKLLEY